MMIGKVHLDLDNNRYLRMDITAMGGGWCLAVMGREVDVRRFLKHITESACVVLSGREFHCIGPRSLG